MCIRDRGMGAHRMNVPEELAEYKLERAELAIALPSDWKLDQESMKDEKWYWPIRLLKSLARLPINCDSWLGHGHTVENREPFADNTKPVSYTHLDVYKRQLLKINDGFRTEEFRRLGLIGGSEDWERLVRGVIQEFEENNSMLTEVSLIHCVINGLI